MSGLLAAFVIVMGAGLSLQPLLNARIAGLAGNPLYGAAFSVTVSTLTLICIILAARLPLPNTRALATAPLWMWAGGIIGAFVVLSALMATPRLGAATTVALFIAGQLAASLLIDRFGLLGVPVRDLSALRVLGVGCLMTGVLLIRWG